MKIAASKLLFAIGMKDRDLGIPGLAEVYGKSAFVCPYCDGWELRDQQLVVINRGATLMHFVPLLSGWSKQLVVCTNGPDELSEAEREELRAHNIPVFNAPIHSIQSNQGMVSHIKLEDGTEISCTGIFFKPELELDRICQLPLVAGCWILESLKSMSLEKLVYLVFMQQGMQLHTYTNLLLLLLQVLYPQLQ